MQKRAATKQSICETVNKTFLDVLHYMLSLEPIVHQDDGESPLIGNEEDDYQISAPALSNLMIYFMS